MLQTTIPAASHTRVPACTPCTNPSRPPSPGLHVHVCMCAARHIQCSGSHASTADWWQVTRKPLQAYHAVSCLHRPTAPGGGAARVQLCTCAVNSLARSPLNQPLGATGNALHAPLASTLAAWHLHPAGAPVIAVPSTIVGTTQLVVAPFGHNLRLDCILELLQQTNRNVWCLLQASLPFVWGHQRQ